MFMRETAHGSVGDATTTAASVMLQNRLVFLPHTRVLPTCLTSLCKMTITALRSHVTAPTHPTVAAALTKMAESNAHTSSVSHLPQQDVNTSFPLTPRTFKRP